MVLTHSGPCLATGLAGSRRDYNNNTGCHYYSNYIVNAFHSCFLDHPIACQYIPLIFPESSYYLSMHSTHSCVLLLALLTTSWGLGGDTSTHEWAAVVQASLERAHPRAVLRPGPPLWTACGLLVDCLWTACGLLVDCLWTACGLLLTDVTNIYIIIT